MEIVLPILGGAVGAALLGLLGAWIASRREHERWLREKRFDIYMLLLAQVDKVVLLAKSASAPGMTPQGAKEVLDGGQAIKLALDTAAAELSVLAQFRAGRAATRLVGAITAWSTDLTKGDAEVTKARGDYVIAVRADIGIPSGPWHVRTAEKIKLKYEIGKLKRQLRKLKRGLPEDDKD